MENVYQPSTLELTCHPQQHNQQHQQQQDEILEFLHLDMHHLYEEERTNNLQIAPSLMNIQSDENTTIEINIITETEIHYDYCDPSVLTALETPTAPQHPIQVHFDGGRDVYLSKETTKCKTKRIGNMGEIAPLISVTVENEITEYPSTNNISLA